MRSQILKPSPRYAAKLRVTYSLIALAILATGAIIGLMVTLGEGRIDPLLISVLVSGLVTVLFWLPAMFLAGAYYRSLSYEIQDDEVIVRVGIVTKSVKHVPCRTVTNLTVSRGPLDRWFFDLGSLKIQTAGMSGQQGAEENLGQGQGFGILSDRVVPVHSGVGDRPRPEPRPRQLSRGATTQGGGCGQAAGLFG